MIQRLMMFFSSLMCVTVLSISSYEVIEDQNTLAILSPSLKNIIFSKVRLENGLEALIISDPDAIQSASALSVGAGYWNDPQEYPGMAHFCEHMLFMGSKKYPNESYFMEEVGAANGYTNAYTASDRTVYSFVSSHDHFDSLLDIFGQFFVSPLFKEESVERELKAVNQEHEKNRENDPHRIHYIIQELANTDHPFHKFSCGNQETLSPVAIETLKNWYRVHYSSDLMHLVIYTKDNPEEMAGKVEKIFKDVPKSQPPKLNVDANAYTPLHGTITFVKPIKDLRTIQFYWEMPKEIALDSGSKIGELMAYTLRNKGESSLFSFLKKDNLIEDLHAVCHKDAKDSMFLVLNIDLTKKGIQNYDSVIQATFQTINQFKKKTLPPHIFSEYKKIQELDYEWQSRRSPFDLVMECADLLVEENLSTFPLKTISLQHFKPKAIQDLFQKMTPEQTAIVVIASPEYLKQKFDRKEKWLGGEYCVIKIDEQKLSLWAAIDPDPHLGVPLVNQFIPANLSLITQEKSPLPTAPELLCDEVGDKCYFMQDTFYLVPEINFQIGIKSPEISAHRKNIALVDLCIALLEYKLASQISLAQEAGLHVSFRQNDLKLECKVHGYSDKAKLFSSAIMDAIISLSPTKEEFDVCKIALLTDYENKQKSLPYTIATHTLMSVLYERCPTGKELIEPLQQITWEDFLLFHEKMIANVYLEGLITGNIAPLQAKEFWNQIKSSFKTGLFPSEQHYKLKSLSLPGQEGPYVLHESSDLQGNAALLSLQMGSADFRTLAAKEILIKPLHESFFDTLRTKQQVGYIVRAWPIEDDKHVMMVFGAHSTLVSPQELLIRFDLFLDEYLNSFDISFSKERFDQVKEAVLAKLVKPSENLYVHSIALYQKAFFFGGNFERKLELIKALQGLSYTDFQTIVKESLSKENRKRLAILIKGSIDPAFSYKPITTSELKEKYSETT